MRADAPPDLGGLYDRVRLREEADVVRVGLEVAVVVGDAAAREVAREDLAAGRRLFSAAVVNRRLRASCWRVTTSPQFSQRPERISISDSISSPATASARTGSGSVAAFSSV